MILIISESPEKSTDEVVEWFNFLNIDYLRLNDRDTQNILEDFRINNGTIELVFKGTKENFKLSDIDAVWFRRGHFYIHSGIDFRVIEGQNIRKQLITHLENEDKTLLHFIYQQLKTKRSLNIPTVYNMNKLIGLHKAIEAGLSVPNTLVTKKKEVVKNFNTEQGELITKNIQDVLSVHTKKVSIGHQTNLLNKEAVNEIESDFYYSLFQKNIPKKYELRVFYLNRKCFTAAIFSQRNEKTKIDYRNYDDLKMNRIVPYSLPKTEEMKIDTFMKSIEMESGSIDIIVDTSDNYIFLEVNPVGQFDYVGKNCNYQLERAIADFFIQN